MTTTTGVEVRQGQGIGSGQGSACGYDQTFRAAEASDWRAVALELANVAAELVTVARAVAAERTDNDTVLFMLDNNARNVAEALDRVASINREGTT